MSPSLIGPALTDANWRLRTAGVASLRFDPRPSLLVGITTCYLAASVCNPLAAIPNRTLAPQRESDHIEVMADRIHKKRPRDPNQLGRMIVDISVGEVEDRAPTPEELGKNAKAVARGKAGGKKGGPSRAAKLTPQQREEIARLAARTRWKRSS